MFYILAWSCLKRGQRISVLISPRGKWSVLGTGSLCFNLKALLGLKAICRGIMYGPRLAIVIRFWSSNIQHQKWMHNLTLENCTE